MIYRDEMHWLFQDQSDPFSLVADELSMVANRLREMVVAEVKKVLFLITVRKFVTISEQ